MGLLKCSKASLEGAWNPKGPWPRFSRRWPFGIYRIHPFCAT